mmetsp:Transcript_29000/g.79577  ORF Transcript_29000/g.79577 Transcript_29000/m.79577 type:complete len:398 (-) Transcript_29000:28-1221(-)
MNDDAPRNSKRKQKPPQRREQAKDDDVHETKEEKRGIEERYCPTDRLPPDEPDDATVSSQESLAHHRLTLYEIHRKPRFLEESSNTKIMPRPSTESDNDTKPKHDQNPKSATRFLGSGRPNEPEDDIRITCDYETLLNEFRCVICFSTLTRAKIVRDCLHRFCDTCVETCLRRFKTNACPVCRKDIPTRRNLTVDGVYNTLIDSLRLNEGEKVGKRASVQQQVDEAAEIAKSLRTEQSPAKLQVAIARKQRLEKKRRQKETQQGGGGDFHFDQDEERVKAAQSTAVPLVNLHLKPNPHEEVVLRPLDLPLIRIAGDATISVLESFMKQKLRLQLPNPNGSVYFCTTSWGAPIPRKVKLTNLLIKSGHGPSRSKENSDGRKAPKSVALYYRQTKHMQR